MERIKKRWEDQELVHINRRLTHTSFNRYSSVEDAVQFNTERCTNKIGLNGDWKFLFLEAPEYSPQGFTEQGFDTAAWDSIQVPSCWQIKGYGNMHYSDVLYLFPLNPPFVPAKNPTGIYKRKINLDGNWLKERSILKFHGVDSAYDIWVNGTHVGFSKVSRLPSEFDISELLKEGENDLTVRVYQWSDGTYLEDQDMWWMSGIFRDVELLNEPDGCIRDMRITSLLDEKYKDGKLSVEVDVPLGKEKEDFSVKWHLYGKEQREITGGTILIQDGVGEISQTISGICHWTAETPNLYTVVLELYNGEEFVEAISNRIGFRTIEIKNNNIMVNGKVILFNGVNRHDYDPAGGRTTQKEKVLEDIILMKQHNINALRCSHYPANEYLYDFCDEYGLYVIDEADLECHGFEWSQRYDWITDDPSWESAYVDRAERMVARDRNHPSVIMWSLGNESTYGCNFKASAKRVRELDSSRLVHYEGDFEAETADVYSTMYTRLDKMKIIAEGTDKQNKPHILCEYGHAMGNGPGGLKEYQDLFRKYKRLQGGFIWEWYDHGIQTVNEDGEIYYKYGGNYGDFPTNGNFCIDGVLMPDRTPSPGLVELKQIIAPIEIRQQNGKMNTVILKNYYDFLSMDDFYLAWSISFDNQILEEGRIDKIHLMPGDETKVEIPFEEFQPEENTDYYLNILICIKKDTAYAKAGHEISKSQFVLPIQKMVLESRKRGNTLQVLSDEIFCTVINSSVEVKFHKVYGKLLSYKVDDEIYITSGPSMTVNRAVIDNDMYKKEDWNNKYFIQKSDEQMESFEITEKEGKVVLDIHNYFSCCNQSWGFRCNYEYTVYEDGGLSLHITGKAIQNGKLEPPFLPRIGMEMKADKSLRNIRWYGKGFGESYIDSMAAAVMGVYEADIEEMHTNYVYPQENGHRENIKWVSLGNASKSFMIQGELPFSMDVHDYTIEALEKANHPHEIQKSEEVILHLDYKHSGLGSNSCGEEQQEQYKTKLEDFELSFRMSITEKGREIETGKRRYKD